MYHLFRLNQIKIMRTKISILFIISVFFISCNKEDSNGSDVSYLNCPDDKHPHAIDLGLPSGTKWACCNVGAKLPEAYGGYYAWGETSEKELYRDETYLFKGQNNVTDISGTSRDVAHVTMRGSWRMPTEKQFKELLDNCVISISQMNGIKGISVLGNNGGRIFLPCAGSRDKEYSGRGYWSLFWASTHLLDDTYGYKGLDINSNEDYEQHAWITGEEVPYYGYSVRAVCQ